MFVSSFLALWWPKIDRKSGFPQLFAKTVGSIHFIPGIYTYGVSLWTPIDFRVRALIFGPLVAKNWPKIGVSATFRENCRLDSFHPWDLYLWGKSLDPYRFSCSCPHFWPSGGQKLTENRGFRNFSRKEPRYLPYHDTLVGRVMPKFFSNKFFLNDSHQCSYHNDLKIGLFVGYFLMGWVLIRAGVYCPHLWAQLVATVLSTNFVIMMGLRYGNAFHITGILCWGSWGISRRPTTQAIEWTLELPEIWHAGVLMWRNCNSNCAEYNNIVFS